MSPSIVFQSLIFVIKIFIIYLDYILTSPPTPPRFSPAPYPPIFMLFFSVALFISLSLKKKKMKVKISKQKKNQNKIKIPSQTKIHTTPIPMQPIFCWSTIPGHETCSGVWLIYLLTLQMFLNLSDIWGSVYL